MASSTRARVSRLTGELEFSTREIVPMPTEAARATSRIVVFVGTASITIRPFCRLPFLAQVRWEKPSTPSFLGKSSTPAQPYFHRIRGSRPHQARIWKGGRTDCYFAFALDTGFLLG